jgi:hypothetical protein
MNHGTPADKIKTPLRAKIFDGTLKKPKFTASRSRAMIRALHAMGRRGDGAQRGSRIFL